MDKRSILILMLCALLIGLVGYLKPVSVDWQNAFRPAALAMLRGENPYHQPGAVFNPAWAILALIPLAVLPLHVGQALLFMLSLSSFALVALRLGATRLTLVLFLLSPLVAASLMDGNLDAFVLLAILLPPRWGLFLALIKPQTGLGLAVFWLVRAARQRQVWSIFWPVGLALALTLLIYGLPSARHVPVLLDMRWNVSLWPRSIPVGLVLLVHAIRHDLPRPALAAAPCLSPYLTSPSWSAALVGLVDRPAEMLAAFVGLWLVIMF